MARPILINLNPVKLNCFPFMISLDKCSESCNVVENLSTKIYVSSEAKDINVKVFNMIKRIYKSKAMAKHISCNCKCKFNRTTCNSNQKWNNETCHCQCKNYRMCRKDGILAHVFVRIASI